MGDNRKNTMIALLLGALVIMAVAYAAFSTALNINGTASINSTWNVAFDETKTQAENGVVSPTTGTGGTTAPSGTVSYTDGQHAVINATLNQPGDSVVFTLTVKNTGSINATLGAITTGATSGCTCSGSTCTSTGGHIQFTVGSFSTTSLAATNGTATIQVTATFLNTDVSSLTAAESATISVSFTATQAS